MEQTIKKTTEKLSNGTISKDEANKILLGLLSVINRRELLIDFLNYHLENDLEGTEANWIGQTVDNFLKIN